MSFIPLVIKKDGTPVGVASTNINVTGSVLVTNSSGSIDLEFTAPNLDLVSENSSTPIKPIAVGQNSIAIGNGARARHKGSFVTASDKFSSAGDAQTGNYQLFALTDSATPVEALVGWTDKLVLPSFSTWMVKISVVGRQINSGSGHAGYTFSGVVYRGDTTNSIAYQGLMTKTVIAESNPDWDASVELDQTSGALVVFVRGEPGKTIRWLCAIETVEITS